MDDKHKNPILTVKDLNVSFDGHKILDHISFDVARDDTLAIIGPNGAGKSVLFRALLNLVPYTGTVTWEKDTVIGYVPQKLSVAKDIPITVGEFLQIKEIDMTRIMEVLRMVGFDRGTKHTVHRGSRILTSKIGVLSGGEFQRVMIAFAILGNPHVLLFDEPTTGVDVSAEETVYSLIDNLKKEKDLTIIFISHEIDVVNKYAENVLCLNKQKVCMGPPSKVMEKKTLEQLYGPDVQIHVHNHGK